MSSATDYEPVEPGGGKLEKALRKVWPFVWLAVVYFGIAWWRGEPPSWGTVFNVASVTAAVLALLGWKSSPERRLKKRLRRLFSRGGVPEAAEVLAVLEGSEKDSPFLELTERYSLGMLPPEEYFREMAGLLGLERAFNGTRAALLLAALGAALAAAGAG